MGDVFKECAPQGGFAKQNQLRQTFVLDRFYPALRVGIQIRTPGWKLEWLYMTRFDKRAKGIREFRVAVMDEVSTVFEEAPFLHGDIPSNLHHTGFIRMWCDADHLNTTALEMNKEQHVVGDQAAQCEHFHGEEGDWSKLSDQSYMAKRALVDF